MKKFMFLGLALVLTGCGSEKKYLKDARDLADKIVGMDCAEIKRAAVVLRDEADKRLKE